MILKLKTDCFQPNCWWSWLKVFSNKQQILGIVVAVSRSKFKQVLNGLSFYLWCLGANSNKCSMVSLFTFGVLEQIQTSA